MTVDGLLMIVTIALTLLGINLYLLCRLLVVTLRRKKILPPPANSSGRNRGQGYRGGSH